ncbi:hypothetical protein K503DRAFT_864081 [Rhizopogon vinicolor AM-OR11-026]|uniref:BTB domain-containing protein n=1 Tax=Rhizopogon vinicolor AM-OR11-026 TaxID=1314800 RepID=A0A1B7N8C7_9AGAM|nr:hypothetical protein K503DRAFT_864081 [Rhizopogon vinicolor AM-OR11-026]
MATVTNPAHILIARHSRGPTINPSASLSSPTETHAVTNPSHILIARSSRGPTINPSASLSSPTETHAAAAGIFRSSGSPPWFLEECETDDLVTELSLYDSEEGIEIDETFTSNGKFPGTVKIVVEGTTFWAHKEVLIFASPFFEAALSGSWAETGRPQSMSSVITIAQPPTVPGEKCVIEKPSRMTVTREDSSDTESPVEVENPPRSDTESCPSGSEDSESDSKAYAHDNSLAKLQGTAGSREALSSCGTTGKQRTDDRQRRESQTARATVKRRRRTNRHDAVIVLKEEKANTFHDFLKFVYPHLQCTITWKNVEGLMNISHKLCVPTLQQECLTFLLTHAAGKPIKAMRIAELFEEEELYRESSRFVLDNPGGWSEEELSTLSQETLLKLEKRRNWFLERVLKLGLTPLAKEYQCCSTCLDSANCARLLEEKWKQAYNSVFRFGPCQPSMVYRYLRNLEGVSPPLALTHLACQTTAKAFTATLFDRMFSLGIRSDANVAPLGVRVAAVAAAATTGPRRHFLFCTLKPEKAAPRIRRSRELL